MQEFYESNKDKPLVLLKWLAVQAGSSITGNVKNVAALLEHPAFQITTPNCCYSLFLGFARSVNFHAADGSGYQFIGDAVIKVGTTWLQEVNSEQACRTMVLADARQTCLYEIHIQFTEECLAAAY